MLTNLFAMLGSAFKSGRIAMGALEIEAAKLLTSDDRNAEATKKLLKDANDILDILDGKVSKAAPAADGTTK
jgi:hypothetical protein